MVHCVQHHAFKEGSRAIRIGLVGSSCWTLLSDCVHDDKFAPSLAQQALFMFVEHCTKTDTYQFTRRQIQQWSER